MRRATSRPRPPRAAPSRSCRTATAITIDVEARALTLDVPDAELARRREGFRPPRKELRSSWLKRYALLVSNASAGAVMKTEL